MKNLIKKTDKTEHHLFLLNQVNEDYKEKKSLLQSLKEYESELRHIESKLKSCNDIREFYVIEAHYNNVTNKCIECNARIEKLMKRCERREAILKEQKGW